jgi:hypothetical protein
MLLFPENYPACSLLAAPVEAMHALPSPLLYIVTYLATVLLEAPVYWAFLYYAERRHRWQWARNIVLMNLCTHPFVILLLPSLMLKASWRSYALTAEAVAIVGEFVFLVATRMLPPGSAFAAAFVANLWSWTVGIYLISPLSRWVS